MQHYDVCSPRPRCDFRDWQLTPAGTGIRSHLHIEHTAVCPTFSIQYTTEYYVVDGRRSLHVGVYNIRLIYIYIIYIYIIYICIITLYINICIHIQYRYVRVFVFCFQGLRDAWLHSAQWVHVNEKDQQRTSCTSWEWWHRLLFSLG